MVAKESQHARQKHNDGLKWASRRKAATTSLKATAVLQTPRWQPSTCIGQPKQMGPTSHGRGGRIPRSENTATKMLTRHRKHTQRALESKTYMIGEKNLSKIAGMRSVLQNLEQVTKQKSA